MRLKVTKSKNSASLYIIKSVYNASTQSNTSKIVEKLGTEAELRERLSGQDPYEWAKARITELNRVEKEEQCKVMVQYSPSKQIIKGQQITYNGGYLFLQKLYHELGLHQICAAITKRHNFTYDLNSILSRLLYARIIFPSSKLATLKLSASFLEQPNFELQHIYRALEVIAKESDFIQAELYKNSLKLSKRNTGVIYYDCTNYFFEIEQEAGLKQYGYSKEHKPNPIVQMGLLMDSDGIPLAFCIHKGNTNEQVTLTPLEEKIISNYNLSRFVVCTDAGLASSANRKFNNQGERAFITTQSIKKLKKHLKEWALDPTEWHLLGSKTTYNINDIDSVLFEDKIFYKERWIKEDGLEQKLIVSYSIKYRNYQRVIRNTQVDRAVKLIERNPTKLKSASPNDYKRFIKTTSITREGEIASKSVHGINEDTIANEEAYDGFYAVCTNLEDDASKIIEINRKRWEIEECFRIMKSEFKARPVYLTRDDRISAHFTTCFLSLVLFRYLENRLNHNFTCPEIVDCLRGMNFLEVAGDGYLPAYTRTDLTDSLHDAFNFRTDYQITKHAEMKKIFKSTKK